MKSYNKPIKVFLLTTALLGSSMAMGQTQKAAHYNLSGEQVAISGYDAVSYFKGKPAKGKSQHEFVYNGVTYQFANESNLKLFETDPEKYGPQYGGWCAYAMGKTGEKVEINPKTYKIVDEKLYLFYNKFLTNTLETWNEDEKNLKEKADKNWAQLIQ